MRVRTDNGYEADLLSAKVNVKTGDVVSTEPVTVRSASATVTADRAESARERPSRGLRRPRRLHLHAGRSAGVVRNVRQDQHPMMRPILLSLALAVAGLALPLTVSTDAAAQAQRGNRGGSDPFGGFGGNSKEPIRIDANKLEVFDKEQKAVYSGDVVAVRGTAVTRSSVMTIFYESKRGGQGEDGKREAQNASAATQDGALKRIEFKGPVTVVNGTQTLKADSMVYDAVTKIVTLRGNATVADGRNIQRGELMTYNTETGVANITGAASSGGRVQGVFTPGSESETRISRGGKGTCSSC